MTEDEDTAPMDSTVRAIVPANPQEVPTRVTVDEIFQRIDEARMHVSLHEARPGVLARLIDSNARKRAAALDEIRLATVEARLALIRGMKQSIDVYLRVNQDELKVRRNYYLLPKVTELIDQLSSAMESSIVEMLAEFKRSSDEISRLELPPAIATRQLEAAYRRAEESQAAIEAALRRMLDQLMQYMREIVSG